MTNREIIKRFFEPLKQKSVRSIYIKGCIQSISFFMFDIYTILIFKYVGGYLEQQDSEGLKRLLISYAIIFLLFTIWKYYIRHRGRAYGKPTLKTELYQSSMNKFYSIDISHKEKIGTGRILNIIDSGNEKWSDALMDIQYSGIEFIIKFSFAVYLVFSLGIRYGVGFLLYIIFGWGIMSLMNKKAISWRIKRKNAEIELSRNVVRNIMSGREILIANKINHEINRITNICKEILGYNIQVNHYLFIMFNIPIILVQGFILLLLIQTYFSLVQGNFSFGLFTALVATSGYLVPLMLHSTNVYKNITTNFTHIEKLRQLFDTTPQIQGYDTGEQFIFKNGTIQLRDIAFCYDQPEIQHENSTATVFHKFSLDISGGKKTALVGASGSGKSTLVKLIAGYLRPDSGSVIVDEQDLTSVSLKSYYQHIGYLTQEPSVFDGTIRENLLYGAQDILHNTQETSNIDRVLSLSKCERVYDLPQGLDTEIGERGVRLSGGQRQRLAIAKIMIKDPKIIILDEPTSALDSFAEEAITQAMHNLFAGRTVIIIAHRLQTVKAADDIIVIEQGHIIECGTHDELVQHGGSYAKMLELQAGF